MNPEEKPMSINEAIRYAEAQRREVATPTKREKIVLKHEETANAFIKIIYATPMKNIIKEIMIMRVANPALKRGEMSYTNIALKTGLRLEEVMNLEQEGINIVRNYMRKTSLPDGIGNFNKQGKVDDIKRIIS